MENRGGCGGGRPDLPGLKWLCACKEQLCQLQRLCPGEDER